MARKPQSKADPAKTVAETISQDAPPQSEAKDAGAQEGAPASEPAPEGPVVTVVGPRSGRRRAGRRFGPEPVRIPVDEISADEAAALMDDPLLVVSLPPDPAAE